MNISANRTNGRVLIPLGRPADEPGVLPQRAARTGYPAEVADRLRRDAAEIVARYPHPRSALLPLLHLVQAEDSFITPAGVEFCAQQLDLTPAEVASVATFYTMYRRRPTGTYYVGVCTNTLCAVLGGDEILAALRSHLDLTEPGHDAGAADPDPADTTADGSITLSHVECNAACDYAPVVMVNWEFFDNQTPDSARALVDDLAAGAPVTPSRGGRLATFTETARILAGFPDPHPGALDGNAGAATLAGLRAAGLPGAED
ncbi:NADH-quinone oxidoreductase subunit NuoE [Skermania piniformis]|uniref:NADH-quinone oxidoreductase subunit NuoE n=1 Tax=Skermania pinensis TaxID=39122 RepID=A0ABX8SBY5_9ACTN|nr:NADH-quinone oxidoreductase subunit NuoE [Skermania piniformis]QXQ15393.1 NADH-quinone oxidoreductase subunit NuoE [Skermania piniformis]